MNGINTVNSIKSADYQSKLQETIKEKIASKEENSGLFSNALGESPAVKVDISSRGTEMLDNARKMEELEKSIVKRELTPLSEDQLKRVPNARTGDEILSRMKEVDPKAYKEYEAIRAKRENGEIGKDDHSEAQFIARWAMKDELPQLSAWEDMKTGKETTSKSEKTTTDTDRVDKEVEKLKRRKAQIEQDLVSAKEEDKENLENELRAVKAELAQKDSDSYRRQNAVIS